MNLDNGDNVCRICLKTQDTLFSLFRNVPGAGASPYQKLVRKTCLRIELNDSGPSSICSQCLIDLDTTVSFLERCEQSNQAFAAIVQHLEHKKIKYNNSCTNTKIACPKIDDETCTELAPTVHGMPDPRLVNKEALKASSIFIEEHKCPECSSKRRCIHWTPPTSYLCQYCDKIFNKKYNLQIHLKRHRGEREWACPACGCAQVTAALAARHCRPRPRRACPAPGCTNTFTANSNLRIHMRSHTGERPFECHDCGKGFTSKKTLKDHIRIHTGEKPYICPVCGARFTSNHISSHIVSHDGAGAAAAGRHRCGRGGCARRFPSAAALRSHGRTHASARPFACALCTCCYKFKQSLNRHVRKRHGVSAHHRHQSPQPATT